MAMIHVVARCYVDNLGCVGFICINKEKHLAWFTDSNFSKAWFTSNNLGDVVKKCESFTIVIPYKRK